MSYKQADLLFASLCKTCNGSGGKHGRFVQLSTGASVPVGDCEDCSGDGWVFSHDEAREFKGTYEQCTAWARTEALKPTASPPVLVGLA